MLILEVTAPTPIVPSFGIFENLAQYGALGIIVLAMGAALWYLLKRMMKTEDELKEKLDTLQSEMNNYIRNDQSKLKEVIENNSRAMNDLKEVVMELRYSEKSKARAK
jgi:uncharacterized membrane-anchored protein YhcB (DUF1043 family)